MKIWNEWTRRRDDWLSRRRRFKTEVADQVPDPVAPDAASTAKVGEVPPKSPLPDDGDA